MSAVGLGRPASAGSPVEDVVSALAARLPGRLVRPAGLLVEIRGGLEDATEAYCRHGLSRVEAERRAVAEFGDLDEVVAACAETTTVRTTRVAAAQLGGGYLVILGAWAALNAVLPGPQEAESDLASWVFRVLGLIAVTASAAVVLTSRRQARRSRSCRLAARLIGVLGIVCAVLTLVASYAVQPWSTRSHGPAHIVDLVEVLSALLTVAIMVSAIRCLLAARTITRRPAVREPGRPAPG